MMRRKVPAKLTKRKKVQPPIYDVLKKIHDIIAELNSIVIEKEEVVYACMMALLTREHCFMLGLPGTAKSFLITMLTKAVKLRKFEYLLTKFTTMEEIFGPPHMEKLRKGIWQRVPDGKLWDCEIAVLEEAFKASTAILNSTLFALNERKAHNNGKYDIPLLSMYAPSNELPQDPNLNAMFDRLAIRVNVNNIRERDNFEQYITDYYTKPKKLSTHLTMEDLDEFLGNALDVPYDAVIPKIGDVWQAVQDKSIVVSDRKWGQSLKFLQASALLSMPLDENVADLEVTTEDFDFYRYVLWNSEQQRRQVYKLVMETVNPSVSQCLEVKDSVMDLWMEFEKKIANANIAEKTNLGADIMAELKKKRRDVKVLQDSRAKEEVLDMINKYFKRAARSGLGTRVGDMDDERNGGKVEL